MAVLTIEGIDALDDRPTREIAVPQWKGEVHVRGLTAQQIRIINQRATDPIRKQVNEDELNGWFLVEGLVEPKIDLKVAERWLCDKSFGPVNTILNAILDESGVTTRAKDAAKSPSPEPSDPSV
jgi:hypothetical protein